VLSALDQKLRTIFLEQFQQFLQGVKTTIAITDHSEMLSICHQLQEMASPKDILAHKLEFARKDFLLVVY